jgi:hypothetical protein
MDISGGISNLLQNKLFLQYLSGAGGAMAGGQSIAPALNQITQQNIGAQSQVALNKRYMDQIGKMLGGGEVPAGWKLTRDEKGTKMEIPSEMGTGTGTGLPTQPGSAQLGTINPFVPSQPSVSGADLAGLGPQDVSRALSGATGVEALRQQSIANMLSTFYNPLDRPYPITSETGGVMSTREWKALPSSEREYLAYLHTAKKLGAPKKELTRKFFSSLEPTEREKFVRAAIDDPALMSAAKELAKAGATKVSVGEKIAGKVAEKKALGKLKGQLWAHDPESIDAINKHLNSESMQRKIFMETQKEGGDPGLMKAKEAINFIESKISVGGTIQDVKLSADGKTMTWTVKWKSGDVEDISYVIRP